MRQVERAEVLGAGAQSRLGRGTGGRLRQSKAELGGNTGRS